MTGVDGRGAPFGAARAGWLSRSIGARILTLTLGLLLVVQVASFGAFQVGVSRQARGALPARLQTADRVLQSLLDRNARTLAEGARLLAADYGFRSALLSNDAATIASVLENQAARIGATEAALLGTDLSLRATTLNDASVLAAVIGRLQPSGAHSAASADGNGVIALLGGRPHQMVLVPIKAPVVVGWVLMGFVIDTPLIGAMKDLSALDITVLSRPASGAPWSATLSSLPPAQSAELARRDWQATAAPSAAPGARGRGGAEAPPPMESVQVGDDELGVRAHWLAGGAADVDGSGAGSGAAVLALVSISIDAAVRPPRDLQLSLALITLLGFLVFGIGSLYSARQVTTPLRALAASAERLGAGDYTTPMDGMARADEIGQLAQAFEAMRVNVGEKQRQVQRLAYWDGLTGLPNRARFREAVAEAIAAAEVANAATRDVTARRAVTVLMLDLDRFKHVNDVLGYRVGDLLLGRVAERLTQHVVRNGDLVARLGGDEFGVLLQDGDAALGEVIARRIGEAFDAPLSIEDHTVDMGAGVGIASWPEHGADADLLLSRAEVAMVAAKRSARGPLTYHPSIDASSTQTLSLLTELRQAVDRGELRLYLQPKLVLATGAVCGAETLVRWMHPQRGLVPPMEFIPFAEQTGFIRVLTMWIFEEAARHWLTLQAQGLVLSLSVNLSTRDLLDPELPAKFEALLANHGVPATAFCLEITESAIMDDPQRALATLNSLSALGFRLSIDDFGTGYSSLAYLKRLPVDELKIDRSFVMSMALDPDDAKIVRSTIDLAHNLGLTVVAEGVETAQAWELLRTLACDEAQGYHMGRPMPAADFLGWSDAWVERQRVPSAATTTAGAGLLLH
jgi:diguanylate cyclase (GGDEF)-like protein